MVIKLLLAWVTLPTTNTSIPNHWLDPQQHGERQNYVRSNFRKLISSSLQAGKGLKAFKLVKTINSLKAKTKKEGKEQNWAKLLKKTESYKEIFNLFDKVTSDIISSSHGMMMQALLPLLSRTKMGRYPARRWELQCGHLVFSPV